MTSESNFRPCKKFPTISFLLILLTAGIFSASAADIDKAAWKEGKSLFSSNCASCHNPKVDGTGPALMGVTARWEAGGDYKGKTGKEWMYVWINNWHDAVNSGDPYAVKIRASRAAEMNVFAGLLKKDDIDKILLYVENPDAGGPVVTASGPTATSGPTTPDEGSGGSTLYIFIAFLVVLVIILIGVTRQLDRIIDEKKGIPVAPKGIPFWKTTNFKAALTLILIVYFGYLTVDATVHLGRQQGYQPDQPIRFSHALHAGTHKIDCQYCHQTAYKGKHSNIPSLNTCMNCHKQITKGPKYGTEEIAKIYDAVGWDVSTKTFSKTAHPVEWVRIHNLPDHVFFSHAQHVNAGKIQCQTCHGPVETMEQVYQYSPLSMGWCINCHRQTEVQFASNNYYSTYEKLHQDLKDKKIDKVTVESIGGTECQKCHY